MRYLLAVSMFISSVACAAERYNPSDILCHANMADLPPHIVEYYKDVYAIVCVKPNTAPVIKQEVKLKVETPVIVTPENNLFIDECVSLTMNRAMCYELWVERSK
jgi:hypothetical protein